MLSVHVVRVQCLPPRPPPESSCLCATHTCYCSAFATASHKKLSAKAILETQIQSLNQQDRPRAPPQLTKQAHKTNKQYRNATIMTSTTQHTTAAIDSSAQSSSSSSSWMPRIPTPLQYLFDSVPLLTYPANELPYRSPAATAAADDDSHSTAATGLPTLHVFIDERDAARGAPSFNPSCLKWQVRATHCPGSVSLT